MPFRCVTSCSAFILAKRQSPRQEEGLWWTDEYDTGDRCLIPMWTPFLNLTNKWPSNHGDENRRCALVIVICVWSCNHGNIGPAHLPLYRNTISLLRAVHRMWKQCCCCFYFVNLNHSNEKIDYFILIERCSGSVLSNDSACSCRHELQPEALGWKLLLLLLLLEVRRFESEYVSGE